MKLSKVLIHLAAGAVALSGGCIVDAPRDGEGDVGSAEEALGVPQGGALISIIARADNRYVCAENGGASPLIANRTAVGPWETFQLIDLGSGNVAFRALANNQLVSAENSGSSPLTADRSAVGTWETFQWIDLGNHDFALKAVNGQYVCADNAGSSWLIANRTGVGPWETFHWDLVCPSGQVASADGSHCVPPAFAGTAPTQPAGSSPGAFAVDDRGGAAYSIPITVPPGTNGVEPKLSLAFSSRSDNGMVGMRFALAGLSAVTRCPRTIAQDGVIGGVNGDGNDRYCLDGQRLFAVSGAEGADGTEYRLELDITRRVFSRGTCGQGPCSFDVTDKHGTLASYGSGADARTLLANGSVLSWGLSRLTSPNNTYLTVNYFTNGNQVYPDHITYTLTDDPSVSMRARKVQLSYEGRGDPETRYVAGTPFTTALRLNLIATSVDTAQGTMSGREYRLSYTSSAATRRSLLQSVSECDGPAPAGVCLPATTFQWQSAAAPDFAVVQPTDSFGWYNNLLRFDQGANIIPGDFDGDGKTDFIRQERGDWSTDQYLTFNVAFSNGDGTFNFVTPPGSAYQAALPNKGGVNIITGDFNGDGKTDFIRQEKDDWGYDAVNNFWVYMSRGNGTFDIYRPTDTGVDVLNDDMSVNHVNPYPPGLAPPAGWTQGGLSGSYGCNIIPGDFDGDGKTDFIRQEKNQWDDNYNTFAVYFSNGDGSFRVVIPQGDQYQHDLRESGAYIIPGDFNGDGKTDFIRQEHGSWDNDSYMTFSVYLSQGDGTFQIVWPQGDRFQTDMRFDDGAFIILGDFNGDGKTDFLRQEHGGWDSGSDTDNSFDVYFSRGDGNFDVVQPDGYQYQDWLRYDPGAVLTPIDWNGDGKTDFMRQTRGNWGSGYSINFTVYVSRGDGYFDIATPPGTRFQNDLRYDQGAFVIPGDFDGDGKGDFIRQEHGGWADDTDNSFDVYFGRGSQVSSAVPVDQVSGIVNGLGASVSIQYAPALSGPVTDKAGNRAELDGMYVVDQYQRNDHYGYLYTHVFRYTTPSLDRSGRGFLGFASITETTTPVTYNKPPTTTIRTYNTAFPYTGLVQAETIKSADGAVQRTESHSYVSQRWGNSYLVRDDHETVVFQEGAATRTTKKFFTYDAWGNVVQIRDLGNDQDPSDDVNTCFWYTPDTTSWRLDYVIAKVVGQNCTWSPAGCSCASGVPDEFQINTYGNGARMNVVSTARFQWGILASGQFQTTSFTYDALGNVVSRVDPDGSTLSITYDPDYHTFPVQEARSGGGVSLATTSTFDPLSGTRLVTTDPAGAVKEVTVDGLGREVRVRATGPGGALATLADVTWGGAGASTRVKRTFNDWAGSDYTKAVETLDGFGRVVAEIQSDPAGNNQRYAIMRAYDEEGHVVSERVPSLTTEGYYYTSSSYDALGRLRSESGAKNRTINWSVETNGTCNGCARVDTVDGSGGTSTQWLDGRGRVIKRQDADGRASTFVYDAADRCTRVTDAAGTQTMAYDGLGNIVSSTSPDRGSSTLTYAAGTGRLTSGSDSTGQATTYSYDGLGRVTQKVVAGKFTVNYTYDDPAVTYGKGRLTGASVVLAGQTQPQSTYAFGYAPDGRIATRVITVEGKTYTLRKEFAPTGRTTKLTYPDNAVLAPTYDSLGNLTGLPMGGVNYLQQSGFNGAGQPALLVYGNNVRTSYTYDGYRRLTGAVTSLGSTKLLDYAYGWDGANRVTAINDNLNPSHTQTFGYSAGGALVSASAPGSYGSLAYAYDGAGNMTSKEGATFGYSAHRVASGPNLTIGYNAVGDRTSQIKNGVNTTYDYDGEHHLSTVTVNGSVVSQFFYDLQGDRLEKIDANGTKTLYLTSDFEVTLLTDGRRIETKYVSGPAGRVASVSVELPPGSAELLDRRGLDSMGALYDTRTAAGFVAFAKNRAALWASHPKAPWAAAIALAGVLALGLSRLLARPSLRGLRARLGAALAPAPTAWTRRHPIFAAAVPIVMLTFLSACTRAPVETTGSTEDALTAGANGAGVPVAGTYYFHQNHLGSSSLVTNASGAEVARVEYKPYGEVVDATSPGQDIFRPKFGGKEWDRDSGLYYFGARHYDPYTGRFMTADSYVFGGPEENATSLNPYAFCGDNPVVYTDPSGHLFWLIAAIVVGFIAGAYAGGQAVNGSWNPAKWSWSSWKTWTGILVGGTVGALSAGMGAEGGTGVWVATSLMNSGTTEGLRFLSDDGSSWQQFATGVGLGLASAAGGKLAGKAWSIVKSEATSAARAGASAAGAGAAEQLERAAGSEAKKQVVKSLAKVGWNAGTGAAFGTPGIGGPVSLVRDAWRNNQPMAPLTTSIDGILQYY